MNTSPAHPDVTCGTCEACCCKLEVILMGEDAVPRHLTREDQWGGEVMRRLDDGWCVALDRDTQLCGIYERRPGVCRDYLMGGVECIEERAHLDIRPGIRKSASASATVIRFAYPSKPTR